MAIQKVSLKFKGLSTPKQITFGENVATQLGIVAGSEYNPFAELPYTPKQLQTTNDTLSAAAGAMIQGGKAASAAMKIAKATWLQEFSETALYVSYIAQGEEDAEGTIVSAGFTATKTKKSKRPEPGNINDFTATVNHKKGAITLSAGSPSTDADGYLFAALPANGQVTFNGNTLMITMGDNVAYISVCTKRNLDMAMLPKAIPYLFTMAAFNATGTGPSAATQEVVPQ